jgi:hypothetical protein
MGIDLIHYLLPYVTMLSIGLLPVIAFPWLTLVLPRLFSV